MRAWCADLSQALDWSRWSELATGFISASPIATKVRYDPCSSDWSSSPEASTVTSDVSAAG